MVDYTFQEKVKIQEKKFQEWSKAMENSGLHECVEYGKYVDKELRKEGYKLLLLPQLQVAVVDMNLFERIIEKIKMLFDRMVNLNGICH